MSSKINKKLKKGICKKIFNKISESNNIAILLPENIDPDAYWAAFAIYFMFKNLDKEISIYFKEKTPNLYNNFKYNNLVKISTELYKNTDLLVSVDTWDKKLLKDFFEDKRNQDINKLDLINIDHHKWNTEFWNINLIDLESASTTELIYDIFKYNKVLEQINKDIATQILFWIMYDTNTFRNSNTSNKTLKIASKCVKLWAVHKELVNILHKQVPIKNIRLWGELMMWVKLSWITAWIIITQELLEKYNISEKEILSSRLSNDILSWINEAQVTYLITELSWDNSGLINISTRSKDVNYNVRDLCKSLWGWWHVLAAWTRVESSKYSLKDIQEYIEKYFN